MDRRTRRRWWLFGNGVPPVDAVTLYAYALLADSWQTGRRAHLGWFWREPARYCTIQPLTADAEEGG